MEITIGAQHTVSTLVDASNVASAVGSGLVDVFATPMMIALLEMAASECIRGFLSEGQASVGTHVNVSHSGATPMGMKVFATAKVVSVDRRQVNFAVSVRDEAGEVGSGTHSRFVIDVDKFTERANAKRQS